MSQHDFNIANQGFPATRADINNAFQAIASNSSGATAPATTYANMWWYDTANNKMYLRNEADSAWIEVATIDQTNNEWQITTGTVQAADGDGLVLKTDEGTARITIADTGNVTIANDLTVNGNLNVSSSNPNIDVTDTGTSYASQDFLTNSSGARATIGVERSTGGGLFVGSTAYAAVFGTASSGNTQFATNNNVRMTLDSSGNVGIGRSPTAAGSYKMLELDGPSGGYIRNYVNGTFTGYWYTGIGASGFGTQTSTPLIFDTGNTEALRITSSGSVGINTTIPNSYYAKKLVIDTGSDVQNGMTIVSGTSASGMIAFADGTSGASAYRGYFDYSHASDTLGIGTGGSEALRITSGGALNLGTTGLPTSGTAGVSLQPAGNVHCGVSTTAATDVMRFDNPNGRIGSIYVTGTSTSYNTSSDYRLKENVTDVTDGITRVKQLSPKRFNFIADPDTTVDGFIAHEVQDVIPEAISGAKDAMRDEEYEVTAALGEVYIPAAEATFDDDGNELTAATDEVIHSTDVAKPETLADGQLWRETTPAVMGTRTVPDYQGIDQSKLVPLLTAALQEAITKIEDLETRVAALESA